MPEGDRIVSPEEVLAFWFEELSDRDWYNATPALDQQILRRFSRHASGACAFGRTALARRPGVTARRRHRS